MKITFYTNFMNHHQQPFSDEMFKLLGKNFHFVTCDTIGEDRIQLGYQSKFNLPYIVDATTPEGKMKAEYLAKISDLAIMGSCDYCYERIRMDNRLYTFKYSERIFKEPFYNFFRIRRVYRMKHNYGSRNADRTFLLAAGAYVASDYRKLHLLENMPLKWGYFPKESVKSLQELLQQKEPMSIIWAGRLISWKRPMQALIVAKHLKENHISFHMNIIGDGKLNNKLHTFIARNKLSDCVTLLGSLSFSEVRNYMEKSQIMLFTSNRQEGWGAVLNEAMSSACAVIANNEIGAVPFLMNQRQNGIIYNGSTDSLLRCVDEMVNNPDIISQYGKNAWGTIHNTWNAKVAAERLIEISSRILHKETIDIYNEGPCSISN